uniref:ABC transmembrane type-1 domain-containing protein n=1 Tax=Caenorhabditis japonica TaxID=281687 RepID=A0A8R1DMV4_CAEJA
MFALAQCPQFLPSNAARAACACYQWSTFAPGHSPLLRATYCQRSALPITFLPAHHETRLEEFRQHSGKILDTFIRCRYSSLVANRWLAVRLEFVGNCIIFFAALFSVLSKEFGWVTSPGIIGVSVSYALNITEVLNFAVRQVSEIEANIVSVERVDEYTHTPNEAEWRIAGKEPSAGWPSRGVVKFDKYSTRYREGLDLVLKGISADVAAGEKIGIVGRTGAGHFTYFYGTVSRIGNVGGA